MLARIQKSMKEKDQGFTLIELLVVMIIVGILAAISIPVFLSQKKKANDTAVKSDLTNVAQQAETNYVDTQSYVTKASWSDTNDELTGTYVKGATITKGDHIQYQQQTGGFCLRGYNQNGTADGETTGSKYFIYDSVKGGLQSGAMDSEGNC